MNGTVKIFAGKELKTYLLLFLCSFGIYFFYFHNIFLNPNSLLSSITGDALKNYYTYAYHIKNDAGVLHFEGMNFPFGEHVVYTDCQPLLTFVLRLLPFTHNYLIGILHYLIFFSFVFTPLVLFRILRLVEINSFVSFFVALSITLLSPQFAKINGGHHGLAYGCVIPISILLVLNFIRANHFSSGAKLFTYTLLLFILHPYLGMSASALSLITLSTYYLATFNKSLLPKQALNVFVMGLLPIVLFKLFMLCTDLHEERTTEPYGNNALVENPASILAPDFGPFQKPLETIFPNKVIHFEGHSYLGFFTILSLAALLILLITHYKKLRFKAELIALLFSSFLLLLFSFGWHSLLLDYLGIKISSLSQFRANCRFAWVFYYALPLFIITVIYHSLNERLEENKFNLFFKSLVFVFFASNLIEAHFYFTKDHHVFWRFKNFFREEFLSQEERNTISEINASSPQAILTLPMYMVGSEMYDRIGGDNSMIPSMIYSYHCKLPIIGSWLSRTSIKETEEVIQLLNPWKREKQALTLMSNSNLIVIKTKDKLLPGEKRLLGLSNYFFKNDTLEIGRIGLDQLKPGKLFRSTRYLYDVKKIDSNNVAFIGSENKKPFLEASFKNYESIYKLDSNKFEAGNYIVSLHYHYKEKIYKSIACNLLITRKNKNEFVWEYYLPMSVLSGFYTGFGVFEYPISIQSGNEYEFVIKGELDRGYRISHFLLRPDTLTVVSVTKTDSVFNNFPR